MMNRPNPPKAIEIVNYWDSQECIEINGALWNPLRDIGEPSCQACGSFDPDWDIGELVGKYEEDEKLINERWEKSELEKAHIVAHSLGGENLPSNFFMLCRSCHLDFDLEVSTDNRRKMTQVYSWLEKRPERVAEICRKLTNDFCKENKISIKELTRGKVLASGLAEIIFNENQFVKIEAREKQRLDKFNYMAKNLKERFTISLESHKDFYMLATKDQLRLDLDTFDWIKEVSNAKLKQ